MQEQELIQKLQSLKAIKPSQEWVSQLETRLFAFDIQPPTSHPHFFEILPHLFMGRRLALATAGFFLIAGGLALASQNSLPGDPLYVLKRTLEQAQLTALSSFEDQQTVQLQLVAKRLDELEKIAKENNAQKLAPAIKEYQATANAVAKNLKQQPLRNVKVAREVVLKAKELEQKQKAVEQILATELGSDELLSDAAEPYSRLADYHSLAESLLDSLEGGALDEKGQKSLQEAKAAFERGDYQQAFEKLLLISNQ